MSSEQPFDVDSLRLVLKRARLPDLPSKWRGRTDDPKGPAEWLSEGIERLRQRLASDAPATIDGWHDGRAANAVELLRQVTARIPPGDPLQDKAIAALRKALFDAREYLDPPPLPLAPRVFWHDFALSVAQSYCLAARPVPYAKRPSVKGDQAARFVSAVIHHLFNKTCEPDAIKKELKRHFEAVKPELWHMSPLTNDEFTAHELRDWERMRTATTEDRSSCERASLRRKARLPRGRPGESQRGT